MTMFQEMVVESILLNQIKWSWYHSFQKTMFYLMKSKYAIFSNIKVMNIERSASLGTLGIEGIILRMSVVQESGWRVAWKGGLIEAGICLSRLGVLYWAGDCSWLQFWILPIDIALKENCFKWATFTLPFQY